MGGLLATGMYTGSDTSDAVLVIATIVMLIALTAVVALYAHRTGGHHPRPQ